LFTKRDQINKDLVKRISIFQANTMLFAAIAVYFTTDYYAAVATFAGGAVGFLSSVLYTWVALKPMQNIKPNKVVGRFYIGGAVRFITLVVLFYAALHVTERISQVDNTLYLLIGLVISQLVHALSPAFLKQGG